MKEIDDGKEPLIRLFEKSNEFLFTLLFNPSKLGSGPVKQRELKANVDTNEKFFEGMQSHETPIKKHGLLLLLKSHGWFSSNTVGL